MRRIITFCVLLIFSTVSDSFPFPEEYLEEYRKEYQPALANANFGQPQRRHYDDLESYNTGPAYTRNLPGHRQYSSNSEFGGFISRESTSEPRQIYDDYVLRSQPIIQRSAVEEIQKKMQEQRPVINERLDYNIQPRYSSVESRQSEMNTVPKPYVPQTYQRVDHLEDIRNVGSLRQAHFSQHVPLRNSPGRKWSESSLQSGFASPTQIQEQRERANAVFAAKEAEIAHATAQVNERSAAVLAAKEAEIAHATAQANERAAAILAAKEAEIAHATAQANERAAAILAAKEAEIAHVTATASPASTTNYYSPPNQYQYANLTPNYHQVRQLIQSNPKLRDVISSEKSKKRYLVLYPDGRVEHVDHLEPIVQKHPGHILVNAGTLRDQNFETAPLTYPVANSIHNSVPATPDDPSAEATNVASTAMATADPLAGLIPKATEPEVSTVSVNTVTLATVTSTTPATTVETPAAASLIETSTTPAISTATSSIPSGTTVVTSSTLEPTTSSRPSSPVPSTAESTFSTPDSSVSTMPDATESGVVAASTPLAPLPDYSPISDAPVQNLLSTVPSLTTPNPSDTATSFISTPMNSTTAASPLVELPETPNLTNSATTSETIISTSASSTSNTTIQNDSSTSSIPIDSSASTSSGVTLQSATESADTDVPCSTTVKSSSQALSSATIETSGTALPKEQNDQAIDLELDNIRSVGKPVVWFRTTDLDFWSKLLGDEPHSLIYFFNVPSQPIVEKDTKTIVYSNGTVLEEITETKTDIESGEPIVTKIVRFIEPDE